MQEFDDQKTILNGTVETIIFQNPKNGYTVCEIQGDSEVWVAVGTLPYIQKGEQVELTGSFIVHPDYGEQFKVTEYRKNSFTSQEAVERYLASGILRGVGPKLAKRITDRFGTDSIETIKNDPEKLAKIKGINLVKAKEFSAVMKQQDQARELTLFLTPYEISKAACLNIEKQLGEKALDKIRENPYILTQEGLGIHFCVADKIALSLGWDAASPIRLQSAMISVLSLALYNGHTYLPLETVLPETSKLTGISIRPDSPFFDELFQTPSIVYMKKINAVALQHAWQAENNISESLLFRLSKTDPDRKFAVIEKEIQELCQNQKFIYDQKQMEALCRCISNPVTIITGGPGTGKTTLISILCQYVKQKKKKVALAAPTGRAAKRMQETTGVEAKTIHRLLEIQYRSDEEDTHLDFARNRENPIEADFIIIDETSMLDIFLLDYLLEAVSPKSTIVFVGDENQLPSVGAGNVLKDMIESGRIPVVFLTKVYRQETGSLIVQNSHSILQSRYPVFDQTFQSEFMLVLKESDVEKADSVVSLYKNILPNHYGADLIRDVQILTPTRKGVCGTKELNLTIQKTCRKINRKEPEPAAKNVRSGEISFYINDKVMQIKNNYEVKWISARDEKISGTGVFNGDMGIVISVDPATGILQVLFDEERIVEYNNTNLEEIELAYAVTVHKSQGSEYPVTILVLPDAPRILMTRNLLYTAVSRAKEKLFLVTDKATLTKMIANTSITTRNTLLGSLLGKKDLF